MKRWAFVEKPKGVWDLVTTQTGAWVLFEDHEKAISSKRAIIEHQAKAIKGLEEEVSAAMRIINEMGQEAAKEVRFTTAEFEVWQKEIERLVKRTWNDNVEFIAQAKENLLQQYINLTIMYGEQKHMIRDQAQEIARLREAWQKGST